ncbi:MAG: bifunctional diaminohydroxyphosphoribosylaminopyrimidine deaminase/5-amino-6-(5-phosphoribosylamino)uracil reductase RibD [Halobacteriovoraceae bacterium]|nr:bifunctional diaminohydroxyphosphoribosylaminopyrimidine deaminase/5-amino-6-(5-phosphoribosylamino)uracil reductase RibD [Halobacteriovoraceae bacterium]
MTFYMGTGSTLLKHLFLDTQYLIHGVMGVPMELNEVFMKRCFELAQKGLGTVAPNPMVGSVIVMDDLIIGRGYHKVYGGAHAEVNAITNAKENGYEVTGATLYINLEPCCHTDKQTPPCTDLIIKSGIKKVVIANLDPNPKVSGHGVELLRLAGIEVLTGLMEERGKILNEVFFKYISTGLPFVHLKAAQTLDGRIATETGDSKWISNEKARTLVHRMRLRYDAVCVGRNTLNRDNPQLNIRMGIQSKGKIPFRVVVGDPEEIDKNATILSDNPEKTVIVTANKNWEEASPETRRFFMARPFRIITVSDFGNAKIAMEEALQKLGEMGISSILVEGGSYLFSSFIDQKLYDKITFFIAPKIIGNGEAAYKNTKLLNISDALEFDKVKYTSIDDQIMFEAYRPIPEGLCLQE